MVAVALQSEPETDTQRSALPRLPAGGLRDLEGYLYNFADVRRQIEARRREIAESGADRRDDTGTPRKVDIAWSDPTYKRTTALLLDVQLSDMLRAVEAITAVLASPYLWPAEREVVCRWYGIPPRKNQSVAEIAETLHVSRATVYRLRQRPLLAMLVRLGWALVGME